MTTLHLYKRNGIYYYHDTDGLIVFGASKETNSSVQVHYLTRSKVLQFRFHQTGTLPL